MNWYNPLGIDLNPLILEIRKLSLSQQTIITLLQEQNNLLKKYLEPK